MLGGRHLQSARSGELVNDRFLAANGVRIASTGLICLQAVVKAVYDTLKALRDGKSPHWTGTQNSPATFGHFGGSGTFLWVDPALERALVCLTDRDYGPWALAAWPTYADAIIDAIQA